VTSSTQASDSRPATPTASGSHDLANYVTIILAIHRQRLSGMLETGTRRGWRRLFFLEGEVVGAATSFKQDALGRTLASAGIVPKERIQWLDERLGPDERIETALLASGAITPEQLTDHEQGRIRQGIAAPLRSSTGSWRFEPSPGLDPTSIAAAIRPEVPSLAALWLGIQQHLAVDKVLPEVTDASLSDLVAGPGLRESLPNMDLEPPLSFLGEAVGDGISVEELFKQIPDRSGNLLKLVWMLERGGLLLRRDRPLDTNLSERLAEVALQATAAGVYAEQLAWERSQEASAPQHVEPAAEPMPASVPVQAAPPRIRVQAGPASPSSTNEPADPISEPPTVLPPSNPGPRSPLGEGSVPQISIGRFANRSVTKPQASATAPRSTSRRTERPMTAARIASDHAKRMERDFYGFLGVKAGAPIDVVDRRCKRIGQHWTTAHDLDLDDETQRKLGQLLHGLQIVWQTLTHEERKLEYDRRMKDGHAPRVIEIQRALEGTDASGNDAPASTDGEPEIPGSANVEMARRLISQEAFGAASRLLEKLRRNNPSDPDVLAELGWAVWKLRGAAGDSENNPEDYIKLALTFEPAHIPSLEYHARIALERGDYDDLQERLDRLLSADRQNRWAVEILSSDALSNTSRRSSSSGLRFWRRKSD